MKLGLIFLGLLILCGCSNGLELSGSNVYQFSGNGDAYFPNEIVANLDTTKGESFNADVYSELLYQLHESPLSDKFSGSETIRLTVKKTFQAHFMIKVEKRNDGRFILTEKEVWREKAYIDSANNVISSVIQLDSTSNKFFKVELLHANPPVELHREEIEPVTEKSTKEITADQWNKLVTLLDNESFYSMGPRIPEFGFDGNLYLLETHAKNGYYLVNCWSPEKGDFKDIIDYLVSLTERDAEN